MDDVHLNPGIKCDGCWTYIMNRSSLSHKILLLQQLGKASVSMGNRFVHWSFPLLDGKIIYSWFPYNHFSGIYQLSFISFLRNNREWLPLKVIVKQQQFPFLLGAALNKRFHLVAPNTNTLLTSPANLEISQPAWRSSPILQYKWVPKKLFLYTKLGEWQQNQLWRGESNFHSSIYLLFTTKSSDFSSWLKAQPFNGLKMLLGTRCLIKYMSSLFGCLKCGP